MGFVDESWGYLGWNRIAIVWVMMGWDRSEVRYFWGALRWVE